MTTLSGGIGAGMTSCPHDPLELAGKPIGMYHCPSCGMMVVAGCPHPSDEDVEFVGLEPYAVQQTGEEHLDECG